MKELKWMIIWHCSNILQSRDYLVHVFQEGDYEQDPFYFTRMAVLWPASNLGEE